MKDRKRNKGNNPIYICIRKNKYLGIDPPKKAKDLYSENVRY